MSRAWRVPAALLVAFALCAAWMWLILLYVSVDPVTHAGVQHAADPIVVQRPNVEPTRFPRVTAPPPASGNPASSVRLADLELKLQNAEAELEQCQIHKKIPIAEVPRVSAGPLTAKPSRNPKAPLAIKSQVGAIPVLVFTYNRPEKLKRSLDDLAAVMPAGFR